MSEQLDVSMDTIESRARELLPSALFARWFGSVGDPQWIGHTNNVNAFNRIYLRPRVLTGVAQPNLSTEVLGAKIDIPVMLAPIGMQRRFHSEAEIASSRAATRAARCVV